MKLINQPNFLQQTDLFSTQKKKKTQKYSATPKNEILTSQNSKRNLNISATPKAKIVPKLIQITNNTYQSNKNIKSALVRPIKLQNINSSQNTETKIPLSTRSCKQKSNSIIQLLRPQQKIHQDFEAIQGQFNDLKHKILIEKKQKLLAYQKYYENIKEANQQYFRKMLTKNSKDKTQQNLDQLPTTKEAYQLSKEMLAKQAKANYEKEQKNSLLRVFCDDLKNNKNRDNKGKQLKKNTLKDEMSKFLLYNIQFNSKIRTKILEQNFNNTKKKNENNDFQKQFQEQIVPLCTSKDKLTLEEDEKFQKQNEILSKKLGVNTYYVIKALPKKRQEKFAHNATGS